MGANLYYREYVNKLIDDCPTEIIIERTIQDDDGFGGITETPVELPAQRVVFYQQRGQNIILQDKGVTFTTDRLKMLARGDANLLGGDTFSYAGKALRVAFVADYRGICKQASLEMVG